MTTRVGTMLVVDDDLLERTLVGRSLEAAGYAVHLALNGREAMAILRAEPVDVVLLDLLMPETDGLQVLEEIRRSDNLSHIPVIVLSPLGEIDSAIHCIELGATDYLPKPFDPVLLHARVNASLASKRLHDSERQYLQQIEKVGARLQAIVESAEIGIAVRDVQGRAIESNPALHLMLGYSAEELRNMVFTEFTHPEDALVDMAHFRELMAGKRDHYQIEERCIRKGGQMIWGRLTVSRIRGSDPSAQYGVAMIENVTERRLAEAQLRYLSIHDGLTGLCTRSYFDQEVYRLQRGRQFPISVVMVDVDELKEVNDNRGHAAGDDLLRRTAAVLMAAFRAEDVVARIGGDEFAVLLPTTDAASAEKILSRVRSILAAHNASHSDPPLSFSLGVATGERGELLTELVKLADQRMYEEKSEHRRARLPAPQVS